MSAKAHSRNFDSLKSMLSGGTCPPLLICGGIDQWPARQWTVESLADALGDKSLRCRLMPIESESNDPAWETKGVYLDCTLQQFKAWCAGIAADDSPLKYFSPQEFFCYVDYKYMKDVFDEHPEMLKDVDWSAFGLTNIDGTGSTIWIGSKGASTPCHYDTYGFNLVTQIQGTKQWILFPPEDSECMYPIRIPYEESSVFSQVNVTRPDLTKFPLFTKSRPYIVTLQPGQVLYVPRHWWHYVVCKETAISINTWVDMKEDALSHVHEAVTKCLASSVVPYLSEPLNVPMSAEWINPTEELVEAKTSLLYLGTSAHSLSELRKVVSGSHFRSDDSRFKSVIKQPTHVGDCKSTTDTLDPTPTSAKKRKIETSPSEEKPEEPLVKKCTCRPAFLQTLFGNEFLPKQDEWLVGIHADLNKSDNLLRLAQGLSEFDIHFIDQCQRQSEDNHTENSSCDKNSAGSSNGDSVLIVDVGNFAALLGVPVSDSQSAALVEPEVPSTSKKIEATGAAANNVASQKMGSHETGREITESTTMTTKMGGKFESGDSGDHTESQKALERNTSSVTETNCHQGQVYVLKSCGFQELQHGFQEVQCGAEESQQQYVTSVQGESLNYSLKTCAEALLRSLLDPDVVSLITRKMEQHLQSELFSHVGSVSASASLSAPP